MVKIKDIVSFCIGFLLFIGYLIIGLDYASLLAVIAACTSNPAKNKSYMNLNTQKVDVTTESNEKIIYELKQILSLTTEGIDEILATRSQTFKNLNLNIEEMTVNEVLKLLTEKPKLLRRPILIDRNKLVIGYNPGELMKLTKKKTVHQSVS